MNVLITGGGGFIGRNLKRLLSNSKYCIFAPTHNKLDILNMMELKKFIDDNDIRIIIHTATSGKTSNIDYNQFKNNLVMFENIKLVTEDSGISVITIGSGAEFDRRYNIENVDEYDIWHSWPVDLYGLSKNIISRRTIKELHHGCVLRLFGCFGEDENDCRFIRRSIERLKSGLDIELNNNRMMDFFYIDDVATIIKWCLRAGGNYNMNLVYARKVDLLTISDIIMKEMNISGKHTIVESPDKYTTNYTGNGLLLQSTNIELIGLEEGIRRMVKSLL